MISRLQWIPILRYRLLYYEIDKKEDPDPMDEPELHPDKQWPLIRIPHAIDVKSRAWSYDTHGANECDVDPEKSGLNLWVAQPRHLLFTIADHYYYYD